MATTYITATERDARRTTTHALKYTRGDLVLVATSAVAVFAIVLAYLGRLDTLRLEGPVAIKSESRAAAEHVVDLNTIEGPEPLQAAMSSLFENVNDRRFAAAELFRFINDYRNTGRSLPNVGAIAHATIDRDAIVRGKGLDEFQQRLDAAEHRASVAGAPRPKLLPLLTAADLAALKPRVSVRALDEFRRRLVLFGGLYVLGFHMVAWVWRFRRIETDSLLLIVAHLLTAIGLAAVLSRPDPLRDTLLFERFADGVVVGLIVMTAISLIDFGKAAFVELSYLPLVGALLLSLSLIVFGRGPGSSTAKVNLGPWQPIEAIRLLLALFLAGYFARRWELLRELRTRVVREIRVPAWLNLPRAEDALPVVAGVLLALLFFFLQKDLGPALFLCLVFLAVYAVARGRIGMALGGLVLLFLGFYLGYRLHVSSTLVDRVRMWQSPWNNAVVGGDQVAHAIWAMATGGWFGTGLGLGDARYLPAGHTDLVLPAIGEELGAVGLTLVAVLYGLLVWRGIRIGRAARNDYGFFLATALTVF
ncbi:MAG TPA: FtsW/RodA/SpoVE family cell cycle protein, partial [Vicinamibacterales bacterium]|nr:FtsW/RodA/SpoVE family cell cycle protein [Vicinamibacterales bacterium]